MRGIYQHYRFFRLYGNRRFVSLLKGALMMCGNKVFISK